MKKQQQQHVEAMKVYKSGGLQLERDGSMGREKDSDEIEQQEELVGSDQPAQ